MMPTGIHIPKIRPKFTLSPETVFVLSLLLLSLLLLLLSVVSPLTIIEAD